MEKFVDVLKKVASFLVMLVRWITFSGKKHDKKPEKLENGHKPDEDEAEKGEPETESDPETEKEK